MARINVRSVHRSRPAPLVLAFLTAFALFAGGLAADEAAAGDASSPGAASSRGAVAGEVVTVPVARRSASPLPGPCTALQLAAIRGLSYSDHMSYVLLEGKTLRIRLYPGSNMAVVGGRSFQLKDRIVRTRKDVDLTTRICRFLTARIQQYRAEEQSRVHAAASRKTRYEPLPPLPERKRVVPKPRKVDLKPTARAKPARRGRAAAQPGWVPPVSERKWKWVILHHSDDEAGDLAKYDAYHRNERHWENGCGYHFVIGNGTMSRDGEVEVGPRWRKQLQGAHAKVPGNRYNEQGVGICLVGDFHVGHQGPSAAQMESLTQLLRWLKDRYGIADADIKGHCDCCSTCCPGKNFPWAELRRRIAD